jgi:hypothetical protein
MDAKIKALRAAYAARDAVKVRNAARALVAYDRKHPMASILGGGRSEIVALAKKITEAPALPF